MVRDAHALVAAGEGGSEGSNEGGGGATQVIADCGCRGGAGARTLLSMDATPMLHRLASAWRMMALLPEPSRLRFIVVLREPAERAASHLGMLIKEEILTIPPPHPPL